MQTDPEDVRLSDVSQSDGRVNDGPLSDGPLIDGPLIDGTSINRTSIDVRPVIDGPLIDVIVPVHGAGPVFRRCAASLIAHADAFTADAIGKADAGRARAGRARAERAGAGRAGAGWELEPAQQEPAHHEAAGRAAARGARHRLVIVLDGPPDAESVLAVEELRAAAGREVGGFDLSVLTHEIPLGFLRSANRALRESTREPARDAVLLNSDTRVSAGWLGRLRAAAYSDSKIATVTPFSNNATICSLPRFLDENALPAGHTVDSFGALVTGVSRREYPRLPTGVGFCLYVKRSVLDEIGLFDEAFGLGYGEEVDLCFRATHRGYVHALDDATFVFHEGSRSFGRRRERRMRRGERMMRERYPEYVTEISEFITKDPIAPARARVLDELKNPPASESDVTPTNSDTSSRVHGRDVTAQSALATVHVDDRVGRTHAAAVAGAARAAHASRAWRVLHVVHGWPPWANGATEQYARGLVLYQAARQRQLGERRDESAEQTADGERGEVFVYARFADRDRALGSAVEYMDGGVRVRLIVNNGTQRNPLSRFGLRSRQIAADFESFLDGVRPDLVHVHHLAGHALTLLDILHRRHVPVVYQLHDWWPLCARVNLIDRDGLPCSGPGPAKCARCLPISEEPAARPASMLFYAVRARAMRAALAATDAFIMESREMADRYAAARVMPRDARVHVLAAAHVDEIERVYEEVMSPSEAEPQTR